MGSSFKYPQLLLQYEYNNEFDEVVNLEANGESKMHKFNSEANDGESKIHKLDLFESNLCILDSPLASITIFKIYSHLAQLKCLEHRCF